MKPLRALYAERMQDVQINAAGEPTTAGEPDGAAMTLLKSLRQTFEQFLSAYVTDLKSRDARQSRLIEAVTYSLESGGKRLRPVLALASAEMCGAANEAALPAALALECIHTFSLIHDDLPAMDDDDLRRGRPTCHRVFGEAVAVLAGDWLVSAAFALLGRCPARRRGDMILTLAEATCGMVVGQGADVAGERQPIDGDRVRYIHEHKTARLIEASCRLGALAADAPDGAVSALSAYGRGLGLAFQIVDDLLDCLGTTEALGKRAGKDAIVEKQTYPAAFGERESRRQAAEEVERACAALAEFGSRGEPLRALAQFVLERDR